jgi:hypothetical protein
MNLLTYQVELMFSRISPRENVSSQTTGFALNASMQRRSQSSNLGQLMGGALFTIAMNVVLKFLTEKAKPLLHSNKLTSGGSLKTV